jgi:hypothetical protein
MNTVDNRVIELQELRIGNLLDYKGELVKVTSLSCDIDDEYEDQICFVKYGTSTNEKGGWNRSLVNDLRRIPLTPVLLEKFGVEKQGDWYPIMKLGGTHCLNYSIIHNAYSISNDGYENEEVGFKGTLFVHQLQNLYFALTGDELTIKETAC